MFKGRCLWLKSLLGKSRKWRHVRTKLAEARSAPVPMNFAWYVFFVQQRQYPW